MGGKVALAILVAVLVAMIMDDSRGQELSDDALAHGQIAHELRRAVRLEQIGRASQAPPTVARWPGPETTPDAPVFGERANGRIRYSREQWCHMQAAAGLGECE